MDQLIKATAANGEVRAFAAVTTDVVAEAMRRHDCYPVAAAALGRTMTGALLLAANLKNKESVTIKFKGDGPLGTVTADATAEGSVRGYVDHPHVNLPLNALGKIDVGGDEVQLRVIHRGVGAITQNDVNLATVDNAVIIGFNVRPAERVSELADREGVEMKFYSVIYRAIEEIEQAVKGMLKPEYEEVELGSAEIREVFRSSKWGNIAGSLVKNGIIKRNSKARLVRDGSVVAEDLTIESLRRFKDDATEVREGYECGIGLGSFNDIKEGDVIETWEMREKKRV